jgi:hypothetical protein
MTQEVLNETAAYFRHDVDGGAELRRVRPVGSDSGRSNTRSDTTINVRIDPRTGREQSAKQQQSTEHHVDGLPAAGQRVGIIEHTELSWCAGFGVEQLCQ